MYYYCLFANDSYARIVSLVEQKAAEDTVLGAIKALIDSPVGHGNVVTLVQFQDDRHACSVVGRGVGVGVGVKMGNRITVQEEREPRVVVWVGDEGGGEHINTGNWSGKEAGVGVVCAAFVGYFDIEWDVLELTGVCDVV